MWHWDYKLSLSLIKKWPQLFITHTIVCSSFTFFDLCSWSWPPQTRRSTSALTPSIQLSTKKITFALSKCLPKFNFQSHQLENKKQLFGIKSTLKTCEVNMLFDLVLDIMFWSWLMFFLNWKKWNADWIVNFTLFAVSFWCPHNKSILCPKTDFTRNILTKI